MEFTFCSCPWCCYTWSRWLPNPIHCKIRRVTSTFSFKLCFILFIVFISSFPPVASSASVRASVSDGTVKSAQQLTPGPDHDCIKLTRINCTCEVLSKCRKCSKFEMSKKVKACLYTGYKQLVYCPKKSKEKFIGCQYTADSGEHHKFWIFQLINGAIGVVAICVVYYRNRLILIKVNKRIQRQINS